jgi:hypothetical protein
MQVFLTAKCALAALILSSLMGAPAVAQTGTFARQGGAFAPNAASNMFLLTDGTIMVQIGRTTNWQRLCPDIHGSYLNGSWTGSNGCPAIASIPAGFNYAPFFYASTVLVDGRVILMGAEYNGSGGAANQGAIYNPKTNIWLPVRPPAGWTTVGDAQSVVLPTGQYMIADCCADGGRRQALFNPNNLTWTPTGANSASGNDEAGWTLLPDGSVVTVDINSGAVNGNTNSTAERWVNGTWYSAGQTQELSDCTYKVSGNYVPCTAGINQNNEMGPAILLPTSPPTVLQMGADGANSIYTPPPAGTTQTGVWNNTVSFPSTCNTSNNGQCMVADGPASLLPSGNVLVFAGPYYASAGCHFFEFTGAAWAQVATDPPNAASKPSWAGHTLLLPDGTVMFADESTDVQIYTPNGTPVTPNPAWQSTITSYPNAITRGVTYNIYGTRFNGMSQANAYGDENQTPTNYPLVRITNVASGHVFYGRTHDHSAMGVAMTGIPVSTKFEIPTTAGGLTVETGPAVLQVVANGIPSAGVSVTIN